MKVFNNIGVEAVPSSFSLDVTFAMDNGDYHVMHLQEVCSNILPEDYDEGYIWGFDFYMKKFGCPPTDEEREFEDGDNGGILLCKDDFHEKHPTWDSVFEELLKFVEIDPTHAVSATIADWDY